MARVCVDTCFLIGLYDRDDQFHGAAEMQFDALFGEESARHTLVAPWPILYECLGTRFARDKRKAVLFSDRWNFLNESGQLILLGDAPFREAQLGEQLADRSRSFSLVDRVIRAMILDEERFFDAFLTYNSPDFMDACQLRGMTLINEHIFPDSYEL